MQPSSIKTILSLLILSFLITSCTEKLIGIEKANNPVNNFDYFWETIDRKYGLFEVKDVDWQSVYETYRPKVNEKTTDDELYTIFKEMINLLNDNHVNLYPTNGTLPAYPGGLLRVVNGKTIITKAQQDFDLDVSKKYLQEFIQHTDNLSSGIITNEIGYLNIKGTDSRKKVSRAMDEVMRRLKDKKAIIVDVRGFYGGNDAITQWIAGNFATTEKLYMTTRKRNGTQYSDFTEPVSWYVRPTGESQFTKPVILLTSRFSQSTAETFALAMDELDHVTLLGDTTAGSYSDNPTTEMYNGWMFSFSVGDFRAANGKSYEGIGTAPNVWMVNTKQDLLENKDRVLEKAIEMLQ